MTPRIASLVPSITELLVALGLAPCLVARTGFCIHPRDVVRTVAKVGGTKDVNLAKLQGLSPTHVVVNVDENRQDTVAAIEHWSPAPRIVVTHPRHPEDNLTLVAQLVAEFGDQPGVVARAGEVTRALERQLALTCPDGRSPTRILYLIWQGPWMTVARDTYISSLLARVNWWTAPDCIGGVSGAARYPVVEGSETWLADVDRVLLSSEPFSFDASHFPAAQALCPNATVQLVDGEMLSWYGVRAVAGLDYLRRIAAAAPA